MKKTLAVLGAVVLLLSLLTLPSEVVAASPGSDNFDPVVVGYIENSDNIGFPYELDVKDNYAYVCVADNDALVILDISSPTPSIAGSYTSSTYLDLPTQPKVVGDYVYVTAFNSDRLTIIDVSDKTNPTFVGSITAPVLNGAQGLDVQGDYVYVVSYFADRLVVIDVSNPATPSITGSIFSSTILNQPVQVEVVGDYAYVAATYYNYLTIVDVSNPASPSIAATLQDAVNIDYPEDVIIKQEFINGAWRAKYAYIAAMDGDRFTVVDVENLDNLHVVSSLHDAENLDGPLRLHLLDNYVYVTCQYSDILAVIDVSNPASTEIVGLDDNHGENYYDAALGVGISGKHVYVAGSYSDIVTASWMQGFSWATNLLCENQTNPTKIDDNFPEFSAIHHHNNINENNDAENIEIWVGTSEGDDSVWASGWLDIGTTPDGQRCEDISYISENELLGGTTYWWQCRFMDNAGTVENWSFPQTFVLDMKPNSPTDLLCEGKTNPTNVTDNTPEFSAIFTDNNIGDTTNYIEIWVDNEEGDNGMWASGWISIPQLENNERCEDVSYAGSALSYDTTYYWQCRFKDNNSLVGEWSDVATFVFIEPENWWNENWSYRVPITLTVHPENYQIKIILDNTDNLGGHIALENFQDLRFFEDNAIGALDYWIENYVAGDNVVVWVRRVENDVTQGDNIIYCYYGNASAASVENGDDTFILFDEFTSFNTTTKWVEVDSGGTIHHDSTTDELFAEGSTTDDGIYSINNFDRPFVLEFDVSLGPGDGYTTFGIKDTTTGLSQLDFEVSVQTRTGGDFQYYYPGYPDPGLNYFLDNSHRTRWGFIILPTNGGVFDNDITTRDWSDNYTNADGSGATSAKVGIGTNSSTDTDWRIDNMIVRKYAPLEPTASVGSEETPPVAEWQLIETWTGTVEAPAAWQLIETWTGTTQAPAEWHVTESWTAAITAQANWNVVEDWTASISTTAEWHVTEEWSAIITTSADWHVTETWTGTVQAPAEWQVVESWTGTVSAPAPPEWKVTETWIGTISAPVQWYIIETWTGTIETMKWNIIETWSGTINKITVPPAPPERWEEPHPIVMIVSVFVLMALALTFDSPVLAFFGGMMSVFVGLMLIVDTPWVGMIFLGLGIYFILIAVMSEEGD